MRPLHKPGQMDLLIPMRGVWSVEHVDQAKARGPGLSPCGVFIAAYGGLATWVRSHHAVGLRGMTINK